MKARLFLLLTVLPFVACMIYWPMSYLPKYWHAQLATGGILIVLTDLSDAANASPMRYEPFASAEDVSWVWRFAGAGYANPKAIGYAAFAILVPFYLPTLATGWLAAWSVTRWQRLQKRRRLGQCLSCGYDLRASPNRCPECGTMPSHV